jgi:AraC family transcriptional regulator, regulatory protein of adaptative response / methylated-DNA-[protein]-cysteine methyltransferase
MPSQDTVIQVADEARWEAVLTRNSLRDGEFVYAVASTGIYCRPSCPSRRPLRARVSFFDTPDAAEVAGYRPCRRCEPRDRQTSAARQVMSARDYIDRHPDEGVTLERLSEIAKMSPYHLQRTFKRLVGVSPKTYASARRLERMKSRLKNGDTVSRATYEAGYGSGSRAYEHARAGLGMTPGRYRRGGRGMLIRYAVVSNALGQVLVAATDRGLCAVMLGDDASGLEASLRQEYPAASLEPADGELEEYTSQVLEQIAGGEEKALPLDIQGSAFQWQVWNALRRIPAGETRSYQAIARGLGRPAAARAVARACASNRLALVIPCHRAVRESGELGGYRWGVERKRQILQQEERRDSLSGVTVPAS